MRGSPTTPLANTRWRGRSTRSLPSARRTRADQVPVASSYRPSTKVVPVHTLHSIATAYASSQSPIMSLGRYFGHDSGNGMYGMWFSWISLCSASAL